MNTYLYRVEKYIEVKANSEEEADWLVQDIIEDEGADGFSVELSEYYENGITHIIYG